MKDEFKTDVENLETVQLLIWSGPKAHGLWGNVEEQGSLSFQRRDDPVDWRRNDLVQLLEGKLKTTNWFESGRQHNKEWHSQIVSQEFQAGDQEKLSHWEDSAVPLPREFVASQLSRIFKTPPDKGMADLVPNVSKPPATKRRLDKVTSSCPTQPRPLWFCDSPQDPHCSWVNGDKRPHAE